MMDSHSNLMTPSPQVKSEDFIGEDEMIPLFQSETTPDAMDPIELFSTPDRHSRDGSAMQQTPGPENTPEASDSAKKSKKRKSWGQVLPEPKTNLPPRFV